MFSHQVTLLTAGFLILLGAGFGFFWIRGRQGRGRSLPDAGVSTLVFPPESKFQPSVLPRQ
jgi:hypothetical protein